MPSSREIDIRKLRDRLLPKTLQDFLRRVIKKVRERPPLNIALRAFEFRCLLKRWVARSSRRGRIRILFYPDLPHPKAAIHKICYANGYDMTNDPSLVFDVAFHWRDETCRESDPVLDEMAKRMRVINYACRDIRKKRVEAVFQEVFGYGMTIDPLTYTGPCVVKSDLNALHDGNIVVAPVREVREDCVYQKLINNVAGETMVLDIRVPVFRSRIPYVYLKYRPLEGKKRFQKILKAEIVPVEKAFSGEERSKIVTFVERFGLEYGELDILRDNDDRRIYIIDVNNTPFWTPGHLPPEQRWQALLMMGRYFGEVFLDGK